MRTLNRVSDIAGEHVGAQAGSSVKVVGDGGNTE